MPSPGATFVPGKVLTALREALLDPRGVLDAIGVLLASRAKQAFTDQRRGTKRWRGRSVPNVAGIVSDLMNSRTPPMRRLDARPALIDTGRLMMDISHRLTKENTVEIGTRLPYAAVHQYGGETTQPWGESGKARLRELLKTQPWKDYEDRLGWLLDEDVHEVTTSVPERPFLLITDEDMKDILGIVVGAISGRFKFAKITTTRGAA